MTDHPDITSRIASAFAAGKREGFEEAAVECERNIDGGGGEWDSSSRSNAAAIRALSSAPPPATAQPRSEEGGDADVKRVARAIRQKIVEMVRGDLDVNIDDPFDPQELEIARAVIAAIPAKPEDALREAAYIAGVMFMVRNPAWAGHSAADMRRLTDSICAALAKEVK